jgi:hypothetical protein
MKKRRTDGRFGRQLPNQALLIAGLLGVQIVENTAAAEGQLGADEPAPSRCLPGRGAYRL